MAYVTLRPAALLEERPFDAPERCARPDPRAENDDAPRSRPPATPRLGPPSTTLPAPRPRTSSPSSTAYSSVHPDGPAKKSTEAVQQQRIQVEPSQRPGPPRHLEGTRSPPDTAPASVRRASPHDRFAEGSTDRRAAPRVRYATLARLVVGDRKLEGRIVTISRTGASILLLARVPEGTRAVVRFALPSSEATVSLPCAIVRESEHHEGGHLLGLRFGHVPSEVEQEIQRYVEAVGTAPSVPPSLGEG